MIYPDGKEYFYPPTDGTVIADHSGVPYTYSKACYGWFDINLSGPFHWKRDPINKVAYICIGSDPYILVASAMKVSAGGTISINPNLPSGQKVFISDGTGWYEKSSESTKLTPKCECGAHKIKSTKHYSWCCLYTEN